MKLPRWPARAARARSVAWLDGPKVGALVGATTATSLVLQLLARVSSRATNEKHVGKDDRSAEEAIEAVYLY